MRGGHTLAQIGARCQRQQRVRLIEIEDLGDAERRRTACRRGEAQVGHAIGSMDAASAGTRCRTTPQQNVFGIGRIEDAQRVRDDLVDFDIACYAGDCAKAEGW